MTSKLLGVFAVVVAVGCASSGPGQAEGPKPDLDQPSKDDTGGASAEAMAALEAAEAKDYAAAKSRADAALAKNPKDAVAHYVLGIVAEQGDKNLDEAETHYRAALDADPKLVGASIFLSALLIDKQQFDDAAKVARAGLDHAKATIELHINLASALHGAGDHKTAAKSYGNAVQLKPDDVELRIWHAQELLDADEKDAAAKEFKNAIAKAKTNTSVLALAGLGLREAGDLPGCVAAFDQALSVKPSAPFHTERALCKHAAKDLPGARKDLDESIKLEPSSKAHFYAGKLAEEANDKKGCRAHYTEAAKLAAAAKPGTKVEEEAKKGADRCK
jgi:tetratricopeptide (TPR) repeat protein